MNRPGTSVSDVVGGLIELNTALESIEWSAIDMHRQLSCCVEAYSLSACEVLLRAQEMITRAQGIIGTCIDSWVTR